MEDDKYNRACTTSNAEQSNAKQGSDSNANSTAINLHKLNYILKSTAKNTNYKFKQAVERSKRDPVAELQRRVLKKLQPRYSWDRFKELMIAIDRLSPYEKMQKIRQLENHLKKMER